MKPHYRTILIVLFSLAMLAATAAESKELILSAPPREDRAAAEKTYAPIAKFLSEQLGLPVVFRMPSSWASYSNELRRGDYDFVFDGPHFAAWRVVHLQHRTLVKLPGGMRYVVVVSGENGLFKKLSDLRSGTLCSMASPNLATTAVLAEFGPVASPDVIVTEGGFDGILKGFEAGKCDGMILRDSYYNNLAEAKRNKLKVLYTSATFANQLITASPRLNEEQLAKVKSALLSEQGQAACKELIMRFGEKDSVALVAATDREIEGNQRLLEGVVWGW